MLFVWILLLYSTNSFAIFFDYIAFVFLGIIGAIFANATGAGGGVVFVPFFNQLSLSNETIIATSFAIQCCGMSAGAIAWTKHHKQLNGKEKNEWKPLPKVVFVAAPLSMVGILITQFVLNEYLKDVQSNLPIYFGGFSIVLAVFIYASIPLMKKSKFSTEIKPLDYAFIAVLSLIGGVVTACLSVGVGELLAVYLILRAYNISFAIACAVIVSAFSVQAGIVYHVFVSQAVYWEIVMFAGFGAIIGGTIAKFVVLFFSALKLKIFFATWVFIMGLGALPIVQELFTGLVI